MRSLLISLTFFLARPVCHPGCPPSRVQVGPDVAQGVSIAVTAIAPLTFAALGASTQKRIERARDRRRARSQRADAVGARGMIKSVARQLGAGAMPELVSWPVALLDDPRLTSGASTDCEHAW